MTFRFGKWRSWRKRSRSKEDEYLIEIRPHEGDDAICSAYIGEWKCLVLQSAEDRQDVSVLPGNADWDAFVVIPWAQVEAMNGDLTEYVPMLVTFAFKLSHQ